MYRKRPPVSTVDDIRHTTLTVRILPTLSQLAPQTFVEPGVKSCLYTQHVIAANDFLLVNRFQYKRRRPDYIFRNSLSSTSFSSSAAVIACTSGQRVRDPCNHAEPVFELKHQHR